VPCEYNFEQKRVDLIGFVSIHLCREITKYFSVQGGAGKIAPHPRPLQHSTQVKQKKKNQTIFPTFTTFRCLGDLKIVIKAKKVNVNSLVCSWNFILTIIWSCAFQLNLISASFCPGSRPPTQKKNLISF